MSAEEPLTLIAFLKSLVYHGQSFLVYPAAHLPRPRCLQQPSYLGLPYRNIEITTSDNVRLRCYLIEHTSSSTTAPSTTTTSFVTLATSGTPNGTTTAMRSAKTARHPWEADLKPRATVLMFHGNGMDHSDFLYHAKYYFRYGCNVLTVSYRGYGESEGMPSEKGLQRDAQAVLDFVWNDSELSRIPIIVYGLSLGGAVAIDVTSRNPDKVSALILENTFTSIPDIVHDWPIIGPFSFFCTQRWNSASKLPRIPPSLPILFCSGRDDTIVPCGHMDNLWKIAKERGRIAPSYHGRAGPVCCGSSLGLLRLCKGGTEEGLSVEEWCPPNADVFTSYPRGGHVDTCTQPNYWPAIESFIKKITSCAATRRR